MSLNTFNKTAKQTERRLSMQTHLSRMEQSSRVASAPKLNTNGSLTNSGGASSSGDSSGTNNNDSNNADNDNDRDDISVLSSSSANETSGVGGITGGHGISGSMTSTNGSEDGGGGVHSTGFHAPPANAVESARRFLWDDDEDEYKVPSRMFGGADGGGAGDDVDDGPSVPGMGGTIIRGSPPVNLQQQSYSQPPINIAPQANRNLHDIELNNSWTGRNFYDVDPVKKDKIWTCSKIVLKRLFLAMLATMLLASILFIVGSSVIFPKSQSNQPAESIRFTDMKTIIIDSGATKRSVLNDVGSPQHRALRWLADVDGARIKSSDDAMLQRYALAVFYFATDMVSTSSYSSVESGGGKWMSEEDVCRWKGVTCLPMDKEDQRKRMVRRAEELSETSVEKSSEIGKTSDSNPTGAKKPSNVGKLPDIGKSSRTGNYRVSALKLEGGNLAGHIPPEIAVLDTLRELDLSDNTIAGVIPPELGSLKNLLSLRFFRNEIKGQIPKSLYKLEKLRHLNINHNELSGKLDSALGDLTQLDYLNLEGNLFSGEIPESLGNLKRLRNLMLFHNDISDTMPESICDLRKNTLTHLSADCSGTHPLVTCSCCTHCVH